MFLISKATPDHSTVSAALCGFRRPLLSSVLRTAAMPWSNTQVWMHVSYTSWELWYVVLTLILFVSNVPNFTDFNIFLACPFQHYIDLSIQGPIPIIFAPSTCLLLLHVQYGKCGLWLKSVTAVAEGKAQPASISKQLADLTQSVYLIKKMTFHLRKDYCLLL